MIVGKYNELVTDRAVERLLGGFAIAGRAERPHRRDPRVCYRVLWIDSV